jgi:hypothetical protein
LSKDAPRPLAEIAERGDLNALGEDPREQPTRQMGGRGPAQMIAPLQAKLIGVEIGDRRDQRIGRGHLASLRR